MPADYDALADQLSMTEIIRLQDKLSKALVRRFEKRLALAFSDVVGSTTYFSRYGDEAGKKLQLRHVDLIHRVLVPAQGRIVDTAGDGAFLCFPELNAAARALVDLQRHIATDNESRPAEHRLAVRIGLHYGPALTDGAQVSGDSVNLSARVAGSAAASEIRLTVGACNELTDIALRLRTRRLKPVALKGLNDPIELLVLEWLDPSLFPASVRLDNGVEVRLPALDVIRFGRLKEQDGAIANDIVLEAPDPDTSARISRWHFELHRRTTGFTLRSVSSALTEVDGTSLKKGQEAAIRPGSKVRVGGVLTLEFLGDKRVTGTQQTLVGPQ
jgi:class 3 adenylate cyclase